MKLLKIGIALATALTLSTAVPSFAQTAGAAAGTNCPAAAEGVAADNNSAGNSTTGNGTTTTAPAVTADASGTAVVPCPTVGNTNNMSAGSGTGTTSQDNPKPSSN